MKTLYLDCGMGAAGDMLTAALLSLLPEPEKMIHRLNALGIPGVEYRMEPAVKCGITGTHVRVLVNGEEEGEVHGHHHHHDDHEHDGHHHGHAHEHHHDDDHYDHEHGEHHHDHEHEHHHDHDHYDHEHEHHHGDHSVEYSHKDHDTYHDHGNHTHDGDHEHHHDHHHDHDHHHHEHGEHHHGHHHSHRTLGEIREVVEQLPIDASVRQDILADYTSIAEAEGHVHRKPVEEIHFHEVGTWDAVADVTAVCFLLHELAPDRIIASPVHVGSGHVQCAHGVLPVPAPATAYILRDIPIYGGKLQGELCTPTGAALLKHFVTGFGDMPKMRTTAIGYGMGKKDFPIANCVRALFGDNADTVTGSSSMTRNTANASSLPETIPGAFSPDATILELSCNVDDMTAEGISFAMEQLFAGGAREVFTIPVGMKKSRPGTLLRVICDEKDREAIVHLLFLHTTTLGIREQVLNRYTLRRKIETVETPYGPVRRKISEGYGVTRTKWEYDDLSRIAAENGLSLEALRTVLDQQED